MSTKQKSESNGLIAVVGDRELVIGYRLLGINETFQVNREGDEPFKTMEKVFSSHKYAMIIASQFVRRLTSTSYLGQKLKHHCIHWFYLCLR